MQHLFLWSVLCWGRQKMFPKDIRSVVVWNSLRAGSRPHLHLHSDSEAQPQTTASTSGHGQLGSVLHRSPTAKCKAHGRAHVLAGVQAWHHSQVSAGINHSRSHTGVPVSPHGPGQSKDSNECSQTLHCSAVPCDCQAQMEQLCSGSGPQRPCCVRTSAAPEKLCAKSFWTAVSVSCLWWTSFVHKRPSCLVWCCSALF